MPISAKTSSDITSCWGHFAIVACPVGGKFHRGKCSEGCEELRHHCTVALKDTKVLCPPCADPWCCIWGCVKHQDFITGGADLGRLNLWTFAAWGTQERDVASGLQWVRGLHGEHVHFSPSLWSVPGALSPLTSECSEIAAAVPRSCCTAASSGSIALKRL